jgi:hypothetical protein
MIARLFAKSRRTWLLYQLVWSENFYQRRKHRNTPPDYIGDGMAGDIFPDGDGWRWDRDHWENVHTGQEGPKLV